MKTKKAAKQKPSRHRKMDYFKWAEQFKPILDKDGDARKYETYGKDLEEVKEAAQKDPDKVWTYVDGDRGRPGIVEGFHFVNRIYYHITEVPAEPNTTYWVD
jgi:hypothetical protein